MNWSNKTVEYVLRSLANLLQYNENVHRKFQDLTIKAGLTIDVSDIGRYHRLGKRKATSNRKVSIKFTNSNVR